MALTVESEDGEVLNLKEIDRNMSLETLLDLVKGEFGLMDFTNERFGEEVDLWHLERNFARDMNKSLVNIGIQDGMHLFCVAGSPFESPISVIVSDMSGRTVQFEQLECDVTLETLAAEVGPAFGCCGDESCQLVWGVKRLGRADMNKTLKSLGFEPQTQLLCICVLEDKSICPQCLIAYEKPTPQYTGMLWGQRTALPIVLMDVNIGAVHEGWGRKWNTCAYACVQCHLAIGAHEHVNACRACKCFWHRSCRQARARSGSRL